MEQKHTSVMTSEVLEALELKRDDVVVDATLGGAGHFKELLAQLSSEGVLIGIDADSAAVERAREAYGQDRRPERPVAHLITDNFRNLAHILERLGVGQVTKVLFDLGWSAHQLTELRGFSFKQEEPLFMHYGTEGVTAAELLNTLPEGEIAKILRTYGGEQFAATIARAVVETRRRERILTTSDLVEAVTRGTPAWYRRRKTHPATKTFQALRIAVNDEFGAITEGLAAALGALAPQGRIAVISFHSAEDRLVKTIFKNAEAKGLGEAGKAISPSRKELLANRRARSAKLRIFTRATVTAPTPSEEELLYCYA